MGKQIRIGLVGAGMFGGDVHLRTFADLQFSGISPRLGRVGLDRWARDLSDVSFELAAVATRTRASAERAVAAYESRTGACPAIFAGDEPWVEMLDRCRDLDVVAVATPDHLHTPVILRALDAGAHVVTEKPMCLDVAEADKIIHTAKQGRRLVAVDMHKRYDPDHVRIARELKDKIGQPLYGLAVLEEPLEVSTSTFKWVEQSDPFSYVGPHWVDLFWHYYHSKPVSLTAVGQKRRLREAGIDAYDAVQVRVEYENGMSVSYHNNWITPGDFEGPVNQGHEIVGTKGKIESDQQYRGLRWWSDGQGTRTANNHFTRDVSRPGAVDAYDGYGVDSLVAGLAAICRCKFYSETPAQLASTYPTAEDARIVVAILHAARVVRDRNFACLREGKGAPVSARFGAEGITIVDPCKPGVTETLYGAPI